MSHQKYEDVEADFLEALATRYGFTGKTRLVFLQRFSTGNADLNNRRLAEVCASNLLDVEHDKLNENAYERAATQVRDHLTKIYNQLETEGCDFNGAARNRWAFAKRWLREDVFSGWVKTLPPPPPPIPTPIPTLEQLWQQLVDRARPTNLMGPVIADNLDITSIHQDCVPLGSNIRFEFKLGHAGHLLLLEKATSGRVFCLCPSFLAPHPYLRDGNTVLPQEGARLKSLKVTGNIGLEQIVAVMGENLPPLNWIPQPDQQPLQLQKDHLDDLLQYLEGRLDYQILYAEFTVTAM